MPISRLTVRVSSLSHLSSSPSWRPHRCSSLSVVTSWSFSVQRTPEWAAEVAAQVAQVEVRYLHDHSGGRLSHGSRLVSEGFDVAAHVVTWSGQAASVYFFVEGRSAKSAIGFFESFDFVEDDIGVSAAPRSTILIPSDRPPTVDLALDGLGLVTIKEASRAAAPLNSGLAVSAGDLWFDEDRLRFVLRSATAQVEVVAPTRALAEDVGDAVADMSVDWLVPAGASAVG